MTTTTNELVKAESRDGSIINSDIPGQGALSKDEPMISVVDLENSVQHPNILV